MASLPQLFDDFYFGMMNGDISYEEFLQGTDAQNPNGIYGDVLSKISSFIQTDTFRNASSNLQSKVLEIMLDLKLNGDSSVLRLADRTDINIKGLEKHRKMLRSGYYVPVLNPTASASERIDAVPYVMEDKTNFEPSSLATNEYFTFRIWDENGRPKELKMKGTPIELVDPGIIDIPIYRFDVPGYGSVFIDKTDNATLIGGENLDTEISQAMNNIKTSTSAWGVAGDTDDIENGVMNLYHEQNEGAKNASSDAAQEVKTLYSELSGKELNPRNEKILNDWIWDGIKQGKSFNDLKDSIFDSVEARMKAKEIEIMESIPKQEPLQQIPGQQTMMPQEGLQSIPQSEAQKTEADRVRRQSTNVQGVSAVPNLAQNQLGALGGFFEQVVQSARNATNFKNPKVAASNFIKNFMG